MPHKQYFAGTLLGMSSCASYVSRTHDVIDDVTRSQSRSNFKIDTSPSIYELQCRSKAQIVGNANGYLSGIFNYRYHFRQKKMSWAQNGGHFEFFRYWTQIQFELRNEKIVPNYAKKIFMMMTSSMTSQGGLKAGPLYSFINEITFFMMTKKRAKIASLNFLCIGIMRLWLQLYKYVFMTSLVTSPGHKIGQSLKLIYFHQYLS